MGDEQRPPAAEPTALSSAEPRPGPGHADVPASSAAAATARTSDVVADRALLDLQFELAKEVAYHGSREAWFAALQRATLFINVALGAGLLAQYIDARLAGFLVALASAFDVTFDFAGQARRHRDLRSRFMSLAEEALTPRCAPDPIRTAMLRLDADAPPTYRAVEAVAYNQALVGLGRNMDHRLYVPLTYRLARHVWPFGGASFVSLKQRRADAEAGKAQGQLDL